MSMRARPIPFYSRANRSIQFQQNFKIQLGPLTQELEKSGVAQFVYSQGQYEVEPPPGWEDYFGDRPLYRFFDISRGDVFATLRKFRFIPRGLRPENVMRLLEGVDWDPKVLRDALNGVSHMIAADPEINGILGYSEGAMLGASMVAEEEQKWLESGVPRRIKVNSTIHHDLHSY
jgi:Serine hydrolase (FSH1)